ncbi:DUF4267 domain-containing protein [Pseudalkalibacillus sp. R45]|uniref:DUF4267 domain-containing protein n=1 Tax=Pseudalkalibacillus sp. R45 TaxID=3457433 RepID=UPI003FCC477D
MSKLYWGPRSLTFWLVGVVTLLMLFLGVKGFIQPEAAIRGFGIPLHDTADRYLVLIKADRDLFIGILLLVMMVFRMRKALLVFMLTAVLVPIVDAILVLTHAVDKTPSWIHIATVIYVFVVGWMLYREEHRSKEAWLSSKSEDVPEIL